MSHGGLDHFLEADHVAIMAIAWIRHIIVGVEALDPVGPPGLRHHEAVTPLWPAASSQLCVAVVGDPRGVAGVAVVPTVRTQPRPSLTQVDDLSIKTAIGRPHPGVIHIWKMISCVKIT